MKKILITMLILLVAMTSVFAEVTGNAAGAGAVGASHTPAETVVTTTIAAENVGGYAIGFTTTENAAGVWKDDDLLTSVPKAETSISLTPDAAKAVAASKNVYSIYYKVRGTSTVYLKLTATPLKRTELQSNAADTIHYTIAVSGAGTGSVDTASGNGWKGQLDLSATTPILKDSRTLDIVTSQITAAQVGTYNSTLTLNITTTA